MSKEEKELSIPWVEKFRPDTIDDIILPEKTKKVFKSLIKKGGDKLPNFLFSGMSGTGKTTLAKAIANELGGNCLYINASEQNGIDTIRTKVKGFASTLSIDEKIKIIILDESDGLCLEEDTEILIGKLGHQEKIRIKEIERDREYDIVSLNTETKRLENDKCVLITDRSDECFEVRLEDGRTIECTMEHPFFIEDVEGNIIEKPLEELVEGDEIIEIVMR